MGNVYSLLLLFATMHQTVVNVFVLTDSYIQEQRLIRAFFWFERRLYCFLSAVCNRSHLVTPIWPCHSHATATHHAMNDTADERVLYRLHRPVSHTLIGKDTEVSD